MCQPLLVSKQSLAAMAAAVAGSSGRGSASGKASDSAKESCDCPLQQVCLQLFVVCPPPPLAPQLWRCLHMALSLRWKRAWGAGSARPCYVKAAIQHWWQQWQCVTSALAALALTSGIMHQASGIKHQTSALAPTSGIRHQASGIKHQTSGIKHHISVCDISIGIGISIRNVVAVLHALLSICSKGYVAWSWSTLWSHARARHGVRASQIQGPSMIAVLCGCNGAVAEQWQCRV